MQSAQDSRPPGFPPDRCWDLASSLLSSFSEHQQQEGEEPRPSFYVEGASFALALLSLWSVICKASGMMSGSVLPRRKPSSGQ